MTRNTFPLKVDPAFHQFAKEMILIDPTLNMRKVTKKIANNKLIIGQLIFEASFEKQMKNVFKKK